MKFVILTDTHFLPRGRKLYGLDPAQRLALAPETHNATHKGTPLVIVTGDLAHWGEPAAYASLAGVLAALDAPTILMMGNHDKREAFRSEFAGADRDASGFVQGVHVFDAATIVTLDTLNEDTPDHAGILCEARLNFLAEALASAPTDRPLLLFQHHPPFDSGLRYMDTIKLANGEAEWDVIARTRKPDYMFMGHLHRPIAGCWRGFDFEAEGHIPGTHEPPDYSLVNLDRGNIVIHQCSFLYDGPAFSLHDARAQQSQSLSELVETPA